MLLCDENYMRKPHTHCQEVFRGAGGLFTKSPPHLFQTNFFQFFDTKAIITRFTKIAYEKNKYEDEKERR